MVNKATKESGEEEVEAILITITTGELIKTIGTIRKH